MDNELDFTLPRKELISKLELELSFISKKLKTILPCYLSYGEYWSDYNRLSEEIKYQEAYLRAGL
jgi:hypothetical protein